MYEIEIRRTFSAAHQLKGYNGDCKNLHGHNYSVVVTMKSPELDSIGIAMDFKILKTEVDSLLQSYDHKNLSDLPDFADINPTSEVLARIIHTPVLLLLVPMLVPLIPGGDLYRSMDALIRSDKETFLVRGTSAITAAGAIGLGIICTTALSHIVFSIVRHMHRAKK